MPKKTIDLLNRGAQANFEDRFRQNNIICLPDEGKLVITGDLHGHRRNFERIVNFLDLKDNPDQHVIFQEILHGGPEDSNGGCLSYKLLFELVDYKLQFPNQVHIIMANHDTAVINKSKVMKNNKEMNSCMHSAIKSEFPQEYEQVELAIKNFLLSQALAVKTGNRMWMSHSLPADRQFDKFDYSIFERSLEESDIIKPGSVYLLTWGRKMSQSLLDKMSETLDVDIFILGHQAHENGWHKAGENAIIITSEHNHGCLVSVDLGKKYKIENLTESIIPLSSIE